MSSSLTCIGYQIWDVETGRWHRTLGRDLSATFVYTSIHFHPSNNRQLFAVGSLGFETWDVEVDSLLQVLPLRSTTIIVSPRHPFFLEVLKQGARGEVRRGPEESLVFWDADTGSLLSTTSHKMGQSAVAFAPDGRHVFADNGDQPRIISASLGSILPPPSSDDEALPVIPREIYVDDAASSVVDGLFGVSLLLYLVDTAGDDGDRRLSVIPL